MLSLLLVMACGGGGGSSGGSGDNPKPNIYLSESYYDFSGVVVNNSADHTFTVTNVGDANLNVGQISVGGTGYSIPVGSDACSTETLGPGGTCTFEARFEPADQGIFADQVSIPSNDPGGTATIDLDGEGYGLNVWIKDASTADGCVVNLDVTVTEDGIPLETLQQDDFTIFVDETEANITNEAPYIAPSPVSVVLVIDWSVSEQDVIDDIQAAAKDFIGQLVTSGNGDEVVICKFHKEIEFNTDYGDQFYSVDNQADVTAMEDYIDDLSFSFASATYLYDAMYKAITRAAEGSKTKQVVVVLSDGVDYGSEDHTLQQVTDYSIQKKVPVFTIYYRDPAYQGGDYGDPNTLWQLSDGTGGQDYDGMTSGLTDVYAKIASAISNKYVIKLTVPGGCIQGSTVPVVVGAGGPRPAPYGEDETTVTFPPNP